VSTLSLGLTPWKRGIDWGLQFHPLTLFKLNHLINTLIIDYIQVTKESQGLKHNKWFRHGFSICCSSILVVLLWCYQNCNSKVQQLVKLLHFCVKQWGWFMIHVKLFPNVLPILLCIIAHHASYILILSL
jgi:hypothetical protein